MKTSNTTFILMCISVLTKPINFFKEIIIAAIFGAGLLRDAFLIAWQIPNIIGSLFFEGLPQIFVPWITEIRQKEKYHETLNSIFNLFILILFLISVLVIFTSYFCVSALAPFFSPEAKIVSANLLRIMAFSILFMGISAIFTGLLYSNQRFIVPLLTVPLMSFLIIITIVLGAKKYGIYSLAIGTLIGSLSMIILQIFQIKEVKYKPQIVFSEELKNFFVLIGTFFFGTLIFNLNSIVEKIFASSLPIGSISYLDYASRIIQVIFTIFVPITMTIFPKLCQMAIEPESKKELSNLLTKGLKAIIFFVLPTVAILVALQIPLIKIIYQRGVFTEESVSFTSKIMGIYALGLVPHSLNYILIHIFYTQKEMGVRIKYGLLFLISTLFLNILLIGKLGVYGIATSNSVAALISTIYLTNTVIKKINISFNELLDTFSKMLIISLAVGWISWRIWNMVSLQTNLFIGLFISLIGGMLVFFCGIYIIKIPEAKYAKELVSEIIKKWKK